MISEKTKLGVLAALIVITCFALIYWSVSGIVASIAK